MLFFDEFPNTASVLLRICVLFQVALALFGVVFAIRRPSNWLRLAIGLSVGSLVVAQGIFVYRSIKDYAEHGLRGAEFIWGDFGDDFMIMFAALVLAFVNELIWLWTSRRKP